MQVTASISTRNRYHSTLPLCLTAIANQTKVPDELIIFDDGEHLDLRTDPTYQNIFAHFTKRGIDWKVEFGAGIGQVANHQKTIEMAKHPLIWRCFTGDQMVETVNGMKPIKTISLGELVKTNKNRYKKVISLYKTKYSEGKALVHVLTTNSVIKSTPEHPFLVLNENELNWVNARDLTTRMQLLYPNTQKTDILTFNVKKRKMRDGESNNIGDLAVDLKLARFMGLYLAEGCGGDDSIRFTFNNNESDYINFISEICHERFERKPTIYQNWATTVKLNIRGLNERFIQWFGDDATNKKIPEFVFNWGLQNKLSFIAGYLDGDGWKHGSGIRFSTASEDLFDDMYKLMNSCGLNCSSKCIKKERQSVIKGRIVHAKESYMGRLCGVSTNKLFDLLLSHQIGDYLAIPVTKIINKKMSNNDPHVYNLEVEDDNTYIVSSVIVHNCDDDNVPEANVLETLVGELSKDSAAIAGLVLDPKANLHPNKLASSKIEDIFVGLNEQWFPHEKPTIKQVDHLYSTFLYRKEAAKHGYEMTLSRVGHREETIFTYEMRRKGWNLQVTPHCTTWHYHNPTGGIRDNTKIEMWQHDDAIFEEKLKTWGVSLNKYFPIIMNNGLGDHLAFKTLMPEILEKYKDHKILLSVCFPNLFMEYSKQNANVRILSIADAYLSYGDKVSDYDIYKWMVIHEWDGHLIEAFRGLYGLDQSIKVFKNN